MNRIDRFKTATTAAVIALAGTSHGLALTKEQAIENCRNTVGRPIVQACMGGNRNGDLEACRAQATPKVRACVIAALNAANGRANVAAPVPKEVEVAPAAGPAAPVVFVAPPRTIADITAILDSEKPDPQKIEKIRAAADAHPPSGLARDKLARFYYERGQARSFLGRLNDSIADANKALETARGAVELNQLGRLMQFAGLQYSAAGDPKRALEIFVRQGREMDGPGAKGYQFDSNRQIASIYLQMGDVDQAEAYLRRNMALIVEARTSGMPGWRASYPGLGQNWEAIVESHRAMIFEARGQFRDAEGSFRLAEQRLRGGLKSLMMSTKNPPPESQILRSADFLALGQARMKARQGRLAEAEADARRVLLSRLKAEGKYHPMTPRFIMGLADVLVEQGRYAEAEKLARVSLEVNETIGIAHDAYITAQLLSNLAGMLNLQRKPAEALAVFGQLDKVIAKWEPNRRQVFEINGARIYSLYAGGQIDAGIAAAQALLKREISRVGERHFDTASARGTLAIGLMKAGKDAEAAREFRTAIPVLMASARENADDDDTTVVAAKSNRLQNIVEAYIALLDHQRGGGDVATETFALADAIRSRSVQQALAASSARMLAKDPALADVVRQEQDLVKQVNAQLGTLNNVLSLASHERDEKGVQALRASINTLRADRDRLRADIAKRFPAYADLIDPKPPSVDQIKATLKSGEALLSFYFGREASFVWAVPKDGAMAFAAISATAGDLESKIRKLREALEPQAQSISDIPAFDLKLAYELYTLLLKPVEAGWKQSKQLIVVTNGALGLLPLSLLPTAPAEIKDTETTFAAYRGVPWLARTHSVTMVPSAAALRTLRQIPAGAAERERMIGFGDPFFSKEQMQAAADDKAIDTGIQLAMANTRGVPLKRRASPQLEGVDSAELALLPRLPDTAEELRSIALALEADPSKVVQLGVKANERAVKETDLSRYKVIVFATHGLVPGELNGLTQPALALSAPDVSGSEGDGLLTMEEILALRLDADWVVLSACNTGSGAGAGAEAASGLGRAFFYAGTRALLVTNWSVHSQSARDLTTDLFRRQNADQKLSRGEALRQAMTALMDGPGFTGPDGKTVFAYAHPLFWAPYTIIGDGGI
ncbi:MAG TPA: CHAT domain-containing protein [Xanthobacteraceae bacterium]